MDRKIEKKNFTIKKTLIIGASILFLSFIFYGLIFTDHSSKLNIDKERITISTVMYESFQEFIPVTGIIEPFQTFYLDLSDGGRVIKRYVQEGAMLKFDEPILQLENPNLSLQVMNTQSSFLQAESVSRQTRLTFEQNLLNKQDQLLNVNLNLLEQERVFSNNKVLYKKGFVSKNDYDFSKEKYETMLKSKELLMQVLKKDSLTFIQLLNQAESNAKMSKQYLALVKDQLDNLTVRAPIEGQLTSLNAEIGQSVRAGYRIGQIDNIDSFKVKVEIDEHYIDRIYNGQTGTYEYNKSKYELRIKTIYPHVTEGRFTVDMVFVGNQPKAVRRGQSIRLKLELGDLTETLIVDKGPFYNSTGGQWIFVLMKDEQTAVKRKIRIGRQNTKVYELLEGLREGEKAIVSSYENYGSAEKLIIN